MTSPSRAASGTSRPSPLDAAHERHLDTSTPTRTEAAPRIHGLDALRGGALLLGIVLHSLMPFFPAVMVDPAGPGMRIWLVNDRIESVAALATVYVIHLFRMVLFLLLAGWFARMSLLRKGPRAFVKDRLLRIGLPLVAFWPLAVLSLGVLVGVNVAVRNLPVPAPAPGPTGTPFDVFPIGHLWFLWVLLECFLAILVGRAVAVRVLGPERAAAGASWIGDRLAAPYGVVLAALPYAVAVALQGSGTGGLLEPPTLLPEPRGLVGYLGAVLVGWFLHARGDALRRITRGRWWYLAAAVLLTVGGWLAPAMAPSLPYLALAAINGLAGWCWVYGLVGMCLAHLNRERPVVRYVADASYWMYLLHLPLLVAVEIPLADLDWPMAVKLGITWVVTVGVLLGSYQLLVRHTWIGRWLNGRRRRPATPQRSS